MIRRPTHPHPVSGAAVERVRTDGLGADDAGRLAELIALLADPVRLRVLFALVAVDELCVGDVALALGITDDQSSYALRQLRAARLVATRRAGRVVHYRLADGFPHALLEHCLRELLAIATRKDPA
ncbi:metalloregulator ArsR/SmtB family transcription factor [Nocardioides sp. SYSU D00038]|uniref:ArsR/SmtB family transcription factor n=1 Tax=Nocardioides sp. SYSU D00038 TaxID=2812554 RepID=UPI00196854FF|nr:metalloregulator ArsR/SmtB family transcription factor [Nocardioides sp. SYSU D00038]